MHLDYEVVVHSRQIVFEVGRADQLTIARYADMRQLCLNHFVETYDPTIEDSYRKQVHINNAPCLLEVLDTAGQEEYTTLRDQWIRDGEGFLIVYSIATRSSFEHVQTFVSHIQRVKEELANKDTPIMIVGNKADKTTLREVNAAEGEALARRLGATFIECSAKTGINVEGAFYGLVESMSKRRVLPPSQKALSAAGTMPQETNSQQRNSFLSPLEKTVKRSKKCIIM